MNNKQVINALVFINYSIAAFFLFFYACFLLGINWVMLGVFQELLSLPFLALQPIFLIISLLMLIKKDYRKEKLVWSIVFAAASFYFNVITVI